MDWLAKWNAALSNTKCSIGFSTCIRHFSTNDLIMRNKRYVLKTMAVPTIFDPVDETILQKNDATPRQNVLPELVDVATILDPADETILQINDARPIQNATQDVVPECNCASLQKTIQIQAMEILNQKEKLRQQSIEILSLNVTIQAQSEEVKNLEAELSASTSKLQCGLVRFALEANDTEVRCYFRHKTIPGFQEQLLIDTFIYFPYFNFLDVATKGNTNMFSVRNTQTRVLFRSSAKFLHRFQKHIPSRI